MDDAGRGGGTTAPGFAPEAATRCAAAGTVIFDAVVALVDLGLPCSED